MTFKVRTFTDSAGDQMSVLVDHNNQPLFWPNVFVTMEYRPNSAKTVEAVLRALGIFELWAKSKRISFSDGLIGEDFLSMSEAESLAHFLRLKREAQDDEAAISFGATQRKVTRLETVRKSNTQRVAENKFAGRVEAANRMRWVAKYLEFRRDRYLSACSSSEDQRAFTRRADIAISRLKNLAPRGGSYAQNEDLVGVDDDIIRNIGNALNPYNQSPDNPFSSKFLRARNHLIWCLLAETGMRRAELTQLKVEDIDYSTRRVAIRESKTLPRTVPISGSTAQAFHRFIMEHWSKLPSKNTSHGYLFTGDGGKPLKEGCINALFTRIRENIPGVPNYLTPHTLRRSWNDRFSVKIDSLPNSQRPSVNEESQIRNRLMGWSDNSSMGARYAKRHIRRKADVIAEELANSIINSERPAID